MSKQYRFLLLSLLVFALFLLDIFIGSVRIPFDETLRILFSRQKFSGGDYEIWNNVVLLFRLPRAVTALTAGVGLSLGGLCMQTLFRNPLAGPSVLGITAGANFAVALVVLVLGAGAAGQHVSALSGHYRLFVVGAAVAGAGGVLMIVLLISRFVGSVTILLLFGLMCGYLANSLVTLLIHFASAGQLQAYIQWTFGSFGSTSQSDMIFLTVLAAVLLVPAVLLIKPMNAFLLGQEYAASMGVHVKRIRIILISLTSVFAGIITAYCGPVTFIGVAVPHIARGVMGTSDHRMVLPATLLLGASTALFADLISHTPGFPGVLPLNAITALIGVPVVIWVLARGSRRAGIV